MTTTAVERRVGEPVDPSASPRPGHISLEGKTVKLVPLDAHDHLEDLWITTGGPENEHLWTYLFEWPFQNRWSFEAYLQRKQESEDPLFYTIIDKPSGRAAGWAAFMRMDPLNRVLEVGNIMYSPQLQRSYGATEAMYLMAHYALDDLHYRRYEWKCDALNEPSRRAALRLGFKFEGLFRQHMVVKGRNRDTAWYSIIDTEWPARKKAFEQWLDPENFDASGKQRTSLSSLNNV